MKYVTIPYKTFEELLTCVVNYIEILSIDENVAGKRHAEEILEQAREDAKYANLG